jgi:hypothetical protein
MQIQLSETKQIFYIMKKVYLFAIAAAALVGCSSNDLVDGPGANGPGTGNGGQTPIEFNVQKQNITRAANLEDVNHYNFGVWAWKVNGSNGLPDAEVMNNYLVGWSNGTNKGYDKSGATTWQVATSSTSDHMSPWFYEGLGTAEYTYEGDAGFYKKTASGYMSNNANQYLRYWDLAYANTNFYCYAPYNKNVTFDKTTNIMTFPLNGAIRDGYDNPQNTAEYGNYDRSLSEFMYAGVQTTNSNKSDVTVPFKHMGAQLFIRFYEDVPGYKVEIIDLDDDYGKLAEGISSSYATKGIQAQPAKKDGNTYTKDSYYTTSGATLNYTAATEEETTYGITKPKYAPIWSKEGETSSTKVQTPLMFQIPQKNFTSPTNATATPEHNLVDYPSETESRWRVIQELSTSGTQKYSYSPTIYYPVAQPTDSETGFTFHISYRLIAEDNKEVITVHNATVHVPYKGEIISTDEKWDGATKTDNALITVWQPNVKYTYTFKITKNSTGTTNPGGNIDPTDPTPSVTKSLYPIVFDSATIDDYTTNFSEYTVSDGTNY